MSNSIFRNDENKKVKSLGNNEYKINVTLPPDHDGRVGREYPSNKCSPGYFKVKSGTGITEGLTKAFCPYCNFSSEPNDFSTKDQIRYAKDLLMNDLEKNINEIIPNALGLDSSGKKKIGNDFFSVNLNYKPSTIPIVIRPFEEDLKRDIICPYCGLDHSVFGLAIWCPDCGKDIFLTHVASELNIIKIILNDIERREKELGPRIAAKDLENCLEDTVSIFEVVVKIILQRYISTNEFPEEKKILIDKNIKNTFQSLSKTKEFFKKYLNIDIFDNDKSHNIELLSKIFEKRHPITHNLGIIDKKYIEKVRNEEKEGREIRVTKNEILDAINLSFDLLNFINNKLIIK